MAKKKDLNIYKNTLKVQGTRKNPVIFSSQDGKYRVSYFESSGEATYKDFQDKDKASQFADYKSCVKQVKKGQDDKYNPYAVCRSSVYNEK